VLADRLAELVEGAVPVTGFGRLSVDVPASRWVDAATTYRDDPAADLSCFDWLSAVDELDAGFAVVLSVYSATHHHRALIRTRVPRAEPRLATLTGVFAGADWHERETYEMFGIGFDGHPGLAPLLLPDGFEGHPLRKDFVLAARVVKDWPGEKEPGGDRPRRRARPLGVPENWEQP
jgi:NADH-quinone oxidoreductase subunit C